LDHDRMGFEVALVRPLSGEALLENEISFGKSLSVIARAPFGVVMQVRNIQQRRTEAVVTSEVLVDQRRVGRHRLQRIVNGGQFLVVDFDAA
jgi:hypothetical protein